MMMPIEKVRVGDVIELDLDGKKAPFIAVSNSVKDGIYGVAFFVTTAGPRYEIRSAHADYTVPTTSAGAVTKLEGFGCPHCLRISYHPRDAEARFCGACHNYWP